MNRGFQLHVLGSSAALPTSTRHTSSFILQHSSKYLMVDCCEGAQLQIRRMKLPLERIDHIFISHLHGDHYLGLPGLLFSLHLLGRQKQIHIYGPDRLDEIVNINFSIPGITPSFNIVFHTLTKGGEIIFENDRLQVETIEMDHRVPTFGFLFREKVLKRNIRKEAIDDYNIPIEKMEAIKNGADLIIDNGEVISNKLITHDPPKPISVAICSDTAFSTRIVEQVKNVDLLYHEATFADDRASIAAEKYHSTARQAATVAKMANAKQLLIGHFSARYKDLNPLVIEAREVFAQTLVAVEGMAIDVTNSSH